MSVVVVVAAVAAVVVKVVVAVAVVVVAAAAWQGTGGGEAGWEGGREHVGCLILHHGTEPARPPIRQATY